MTQLIFCFDGTCNDPSDAGDFAENTSISNVLKLHLLLGGALQNGANDTNGVQSGNRRSFYYQGIGTHGGRIRQVINSMFAPPQLDMKDIIANAEVDLRKYYNDGDEIFIFGFSRGAAIARMFAAKHVNEKPIKLLGVFDTVAATKNSLDLNPDIYPASGIVFEDGNIGAHIEKAVHAVAIDEQRIAFQPTLFNLNARVTEVWFAGVHSDIGGGYWFDGLSDIALQFICQQAEQCGLAFLSVNDIEFENLGGKEKRDICRDDVALTPLVAGKLHEQNRPGIIAGKTLAPRHIRVNGNDDTPSDTHLPVLHHTVIERFNTVADYRPYALRNVKYRVMDSTGNVNDEVLHGIEGARETVKSRANIKQEN